MRYWEMTRLFPLVLLITGLVVSCSSSEGRGSNHKDAIDAGDNRNTEENTPVSETQSPDVTDDDTLIIPDTQDTGEDVSGCTPKTCADLGYECGNVDDGCGGELHCGRCDDGNYCDNGTCKPNCGNGTCESDKGENCDTCAADCGCGAGDLCYHKKCIASTWIDPTTGYEWQVVPSNNDGKRFKWQEAMDYCKNLTLAGYSDWKLPTISQLRSLVRGCDKTKTGGACGVTDSCLKNSCWNSACDGCDNEKGPGPDGAYGPSELVWPYNWYWTSSSVADSSDNACDITFYNGIVGNSLKTYGYTARCVRRVP